MTDQVGDTTALTDFVGVEYKLADQYAVTFRSWRRFMKLWALVILACAAMSAFGGLDNFIAFVLDGFVIVASVLVLAIFYFGFSPLYSQYRSRRLMKKGAIRMRLTSAGVDIRSSDVDSVVHWSRVKRVIRARDRLLLFISDCGAFVPVRGRMIDDAGFEEWDRISRERQGGALT